MGNIKKKGKETGILLVSTPAYELKLNGLLNVLVLILQFGVYLSICDDIVDRMCEQTQAPVKKSFGMSKVCSYKLHIDKLTGVAEIS